MPFSFNSKGVPVCLCREPPKTLDRIPRGGECALCERWWHTDELIKAHEEMMTKEIRKFVSPQ